MNFGDLTMQDSSTIEQTMDCNIIAEGARPCDVYACTQFQSINVLGNMDISNEAEIIQNMECNISGNFIAPNTCPEDFDCSSSPNDLSDNPRSIICSSSSCTPEECCPGQLDNESVSEESFWIKNKKKITITIIIIIIILLVISILSI